MAVTNITYENGTAGNAVTTAEPNVQYVFGTVTYVADAGVGGAQAMECSLAANNAVQQAPTAVGNIYIRFYFKVADATPASACIIAAAKNYVTVAENIALVVLNTNGTITLRDEETSAGTSTMTLADDTWYRFEWNVNRAAGTQELRIYEGPHNTSPTETVAPGAGSCNASTATTTNRIQYGGIAAGASVTARYDDTGYDPAGWIGPSATAGTPGVASYDLTINHPQDSALLADRTYVLDATASTGTTTLAWDGTSRGTITESPTGVFTIADPDDGDTALALTLTAAGADGEADDVAAISIPRGGATTSAQPGVLVFGGGTATDIANWG